MNTEEELMQSVPEYKAYLDAHPMEWIDDLIRNRLMEGEEVLMPSEGIWLWPRIQNRLKEKYIDWLSEKHPSHSDEIRDGNYEAIFQWESIPPQYDPITNKEYRNGASWIFRVVTKRKDKVLEEKK